MVYANARTPIDCIHGTPPAGWCSICHAAPPPPAEQASGELLTVVADAIRSTGHVTNSDKWEVAEAVLAAISQRPVVDEAMVERACAASYGWWKYPENQSERPRLRDAMRAALTAALAPQQPEKGEG